jgi:hypothetical protein
MIDAPIRDRFGMTADTLEHHPNKIKIAVPRGGEPIKYDERIPAELQTKDSLKEQAVVIEDEGKVRRARGRFAVEVAPILIIGNQVYGFRRGGGREGQGVSTFWPAQTLPSQEATRDILKEFLLIGRHKKTGKRVFLTPPLPDGSQDGWVRDAKGRVLAGVRQELERAELTEADKSVVGELAEKSKSITPVHDIKTVEPVDMSPEFENMAQTIELEVDGAKETMKGLFRFDDTTNTAIITKPIRLDLEDYDIEIYDATGRNRQVINIESPHSSQSFETRQIMEAIEAEDRRLVQKQKGGPVVLPEDKYETARLRKPFAVIPHMLHPKSTK